MSNIIKIGTSEPSVIKIGTTSVAGVYVGTVKVYPQAVKDYLRTVARGTGEISLTIGSAVTTSQMTSISYSLDSGNTWVTSANADGETVTLTTPSLSSGDIVYWKGTGVQTAISSPNNYRYNGTTFSASTQYDVEGNIMSILGGDNFENSSLDSSVEYHFSGLFSKNTNLINASGMTLPATTVYQNSYNDLFNRCSNMVSSPLELPATTLSGDTCYVRMFQGCSAMTTTVSVLPATTLTTRCYQYMFDGCKSLTTAPSISATTLASRCCDSMFYSCSSLTTAPSLQATTLADYCYSSMFYGCTSLTTAPSLQATTLADNCYYSMFNGCTSLATAPVLPATTLANYCYGSMFQGCTSLTTAPSVLPATTLTAYCYRYMFYGCTSLTTAPSLPATTLAADCYQYMFYGCSGLTTAPSELPATTLTAECYYSMFRGCTSLTTAPYLPATTLAYNCYQYMFYNCSSLNRIECNADTYNTSTTAATRYWVSGVAASGKFIKNSSNTWWTTGNSGIPTNWSVGTLPAERTDWVKAETTDYVCVGYDKHYKEYLEETRDGGISWSYVTPLSSRTSSDVIEYNSTDCGYVPSFDDYFVITTLAANNTITLKNAAGSTALTGSFSYSLDSGSTWTSFTLARNASQTFTLANVGDKLLLQGVNNTLGTNYNAGHYFRATGDYEISGEISALVNGTGSVEIGSDPARRCTFAMLFSGDTHLVSAEYLKVSSTALPDSCFNGTFRGCTNLVKAPTTLPSTILGAECYSSMFEGCTSLATPPKELNFTSVNHNSYNRMFCMNRNSKVTAAMTESPKMFGNWGSVNPATNNMQMFCGNGSLTNIYCYWTNTSGTFGNIANWVNYTDDTNVTFYKRSTQSFASGVNGIKDGWTVIDDDTTQPSS